MMTTQGADRLIGDTLQSLDQKTPYYSFLKENREKFQTSLVEGHEEMQKTIAYLSEFGALVEPIRKLKQFIADAKADKLTGGDADKSIQQLTQISDAEIMDIYEVCYSTFQEKQFEKAASIATLLGCLNGEVSAFWRMLGLCYQSMGNDGAALTPFLYASIVNSMEGENHICALDCLMSLGLTQEAKGYYETAKEILSEMDEKETLLILDEIMAQK